jgi:hypothetical protein
VIVLSVTCFYLFLSVTCFCLKWGVISSVAHLLRISWLWHAYRSDLPYDEQPFSKPSFQ